ncbi:MAG TPA: alpha/beta fold hydrolase [Candidatus Limnocylindrales bacterium]|jgi:pimeloyl-ACP methyl ester carboxylesterase
MVTTAPGGGGLPAAVAEPAATMVAGEPFDVSVAFDAVGPADAPTLVFLHGTRVTRAMWDPQVAGLSDRFRVVTVDLPGHGVLADMHFRMARAVTIASSVIARNGGRAIVIGQSLGGYVAMELAAAHPEMVAGLVLCNSSTEPRTVARRAPRVVGVYLVDRVGERYLGRGAPVHPDGPLHGPAPRATNGWLFKGGYRAVVTALRTSFLPRLAAYPGPALLVNGADDPLFRRGEADFLAACHNGRLQVIEGAGHLVNTERPEAFNAALREFAEIVFPGHRLD